jgi:hypothetical protein
MVGRGHDVLASLGSVPFLMIGDYANLFGYCKDYALRYTIGEMDDTV